MCDFCKTQKVSSHPLKPHTSKVYSKGIHKLYLFYTHCLAIISMVNGKCQTAPRANVKGHQDHDKLFFKSTMQSPTR